MATYSISRTLAIGEAYVSPSTADLSGYSIQITTTTDSDTNILPQYSTDSGTTWNDHADGTYAVDNTTDQRTITIPSGIMRLTVTNNDTTVDVVSISIIATTTVDTGVVSTSDVYRTAGISSSVVSLVDCRAAILRAYSECKEITGRPCGTEQTSESYWGNNKKSMFLDHSPIVSLDTLAIGDDSVTVTYVDVVKETGQIILKSTAEVTRFTLPGNESPTSEARNVDATYTWGYNSVPYWIVKLTENLAAIMILTQQTGGTYSAWTSFTVGDITASLGEPWTNINRTVMNLKQEINDIIIHYAKKQPAVF